VRKRNSATDQIHSLSAASFRFSRTRERFSSAQSRPQGFFLVHCILVTIRSRTQGIFPARLFCAFQAGDLPPGYPEYHTILFPPVPIPLLCQDDNY
jgi:hypothetical protein